MKKCPQCAEEIQDNAKKCKHCGDDLTGKRAKKKVGCGSCAVIVIVIIVVMSVIAQMNLQSARDKASGQLQQTQIQVTKIPYQVFDRWTIPNGGEGKAIVIAPDKVNEKNMTALGTQLKIENAADRNAFIWVFDDRRAAELRGAVLDQTASQADADFYDTHYVGQYNKNGNTGFHQFVMYLDGVMGSNHKTITY